MGKSKATPQVTRQIADAFATSALSGELPGCPNCKGATHHAYRAWNSRTWCGAYEQFAIFWESGKFVPIITAYSIFAKGNAKLPFYAFSALPAITCPGAGACLKFCYSFRAWRYPGGFYRQLQNTILLQTPAGRERIAAAFLALPYGVPVRLYVDGDIDSRATLEFWFQLLARRPDLKAYGYSKSWQIFLDYGATGAPWPTNYDLNLSSGSIYGSAMRQRMMALPITRGDFIALPTTSKMPSRRNESAAWAKWAQALKALARERGIAKSFVCPGKCGDCLPKGEHACGSDRFKDITVIIGIH